MEPLEQAVARPGRDCAAGRAFLSSVLEGLEDATYQERVWVRREFREHEYYDVDDAINDFYDRFLEGGVSDLLGCELRTALELELIRELERRLNSALASVAATDPGPPVAGEAGLIARAKALLATQEWPRVRRAAAQLRAAMSDHDLQADSTENL